MSLGKDSVKTVNMNKDTGRRSTLDQKHTISLCKTDKDKKTFGNDLRKYSVNVNKLEGNIENF